MSYGTKNHTYFPYRPTPRLTAVGVCAHLRDPAFLPSTVTLRLPRLVNRHGRLRCMDPRPCLLRVRGALNTIDAGSGPRACELAFMSMVNSKVYKKTTSQMR